MIDTLSFSMGLMTGIGLASLTALVVGTCKYIMDKYFPNKIKEVKKK